MYESFFGLKEKAFNLTPDPDFLYLNSRTKKAFEDILYGIERREGFAVVVGDVGTGKTTLCCSLLERIEGKKNIFTVLIQNPMLSELDILRSILHDLGVPQRVGAAWKHDMTKKELIDCLNTFLSENARDDIFTVLIIDESQNLSLEMLEQLRLLSNLETTKKKLLQIIFLGQPELDQKLTQLRQLNQRISVWFEIRPLSREDTERYIRHRLAVVGTPIRYSSGQEPSMRSMSIPGVSKTYQPHLRSEPAGGLQERSLTVTKPTVRKASLSLAGTRKVSLKSRLRRIQGCRSSADPGRSRVIAIPDRASARVSVAESSRSCHAWNRPFPRSGTGEWIRRPYSRADSRTFRADLAPPPKSAAAAGVSAAGSLLPRSRRCRSDRRRTQSAEPVLVRGTPRRWRQWLVRRVRWTVQ